MTRADNDAGPKFHWFLPTHGDNRGIFEGGPGRRPPEIGYLREVALAADRNGFESLLTPTGRHCDDSWLTTAALTQVTERIKFLVAFRPGLVHPTLGAQMVQTYQRFSGNRLGLNVVTGGDDAEQKSYGDFATKDERYARTAEFLTIVKHEWEGKPYKHEGQFYHVEGSGLAEPLTPEKRPTIFFGGASPAAEQVSIEHADVQLFFGETPPMAAERIARLRKLAAERARKLSFGIRLHVINRDTSEEAWTEANRLLDQLPDEVVAKVQNKFNSAGAVGHQRIATLHDGTKHNREALQIYPNLWAGSSLIYGNAALVGSHEEVADRIREYNSIGVEHFVLSGYPKLESSYWFGEGVIPLFKDTKPARVQRSNAASTDGLRPVAR
jgi:alkanesulfonate monooxygenase